MRAIINSAPHAGKIGSANSGKDGFIIREVNGSISVFARSYNPFREQKIGEGFTPGVNAPHRFARAWVFSKEGQTKLAAALEEGSK